MASSIVFRRSGASSLRAFAWPKIRRDFSALLAIEDEFPGLPALTPTPAKASSASVTTLSNGLTIVTEDASSLSTVTMTYPNAGSASESLDGPGAAFVNKWMSFKSGSERSTVIINRAIENAGGLPFATVDRKCATLGFTVPPEQAASLVPIFGLDCTFEKWDFNDAMYGANAEIANVSKNQSIVLSESVCAAAYGAQSLGGRPLYFSKISVNNVAAFRENAYNLNGAVLAATGIKDHTSFVAEVDASLGGKIDGSTGKVDSPKLFYLGGESRVHHPFAPFSRVALAFPAPSSSVVASIIKHLFNVVGAENKVAASVSTDLVIVEAGSPTAGELIDMLIGTVTKGATAEEFGRAKKLAKGEALLNLDSGSACLARVATASVLETGTFVPNNIGKAYDAISESQVKQAIASMLKNNPSIAAVGNIASVPYHATIASSFK